MPGHSRGLPRGEVRERAQIRKALLTWYANNARDLPWRRTQDPYAIWVSEIMLQQTRVATVIPYYERFLAALPTVADLAAVDEDTLHRLWKGLGYYRRAALLRKGAQAVMARHAGALPANHAALLDLPGFGPYTAGAVASIAFAIPEPAVDGNVVRVFSRWLNDATPADALRNRLQAGEAAAWVPKKAAGDWNQALMELGATVCTPRRPLCAACPVGKYCKAYAAGTVDGLPVKGREGKHMVLDVVATVYRRDEQVWIEKRPPTGLLASLWGFPLTESETAAGRTAGAEVLRYRHVFTHRTWCVSVRVSPGTPRKKDSGRWVAVTELEAEAIPTAFQPIVRYLCAKDLFSM